MALFQKSVLKKYLKELNSEAVQQSWQLFKAHFQNTTIQQHIRDSKEEEYQEGFVRDLFVTVLGYILKPQPDFNFVLEQKSTTDATKSDGAIWKDGTVSTVVELKDTYTAELDKIEKQAFGYKHQHKDCIYIITSNFEKLRFYIDDATDHIEFNLFSLTETEFQLLYLCLHKNQLLNNVPLAMKQASVTEEENITKKLYSDYSKFKQALFINIAANNTQYNKLELFKKTQKLLDRLLFILFAEDRLLVPPNSVRVILADWEKLKELDNYVPLYDRFKKYFGYLNTGHEGKQYEIYAYNGGLFAPDEILDSIKMDDGLLYNGCKALSDYDFESEVDVNILGHIFEHSLSEIEEVQAQLAGTAVEKTKTKRKKDGVFYTPRYITKYIVENTLGVLCEEKKKELEISKEVFEYRKRKDSKREKLVTLLDTYRQWLFQLTICDPACGSGAFLNQALEFLIAEHSYVDELKAKLFGDLMILTDVETTILENNLFGVDINEEAVEIARLSLWLRTARKGRKLNNLSENIKCGNSLIDDPAVAGDKAFNWQKEFPQVFGEYKETVIGNKQKIAAAAKAKDAIVATEPTAYKNEEAAEVAALNTEQITNNDNAIVNTDFRIVNEPEAEYNIKKQIKRGFDVVIGNPPYVPAEMIDERDKRYFEKNYQSAVGRLNLYPLFYELAIKLGKPYSKAGLITPYTILKNKYYTTCRKFILTNSSIDKIIDFKGVAVFKDAAVDSIIIILTFGVHETKEIEIIDSIVDFGTNEFIQRKVNKKLFEESEDFAFEIKEKKIDYKKIYSDSLKISEVVDFNQGVITGNNKKFLTKEINSLSKKVVTGSDFNRYVLKWSNTYLTYDEMALHRSRKKEIFEVREKILLRQTSSYPICTYDNTQYYTLDTVHNGLSIDPEFNLKYIICLLNSKLLRYLYETSINEEGKVFAQVKIIYIDPLPIKVLGLSAQESFIEKSNTMLSKAKELHQQILRLQQLLVNKYDDLILSKKLEDWSSLSFKDFLKELSKQKIKLTLNEEAEWLNYFEEQKAKANTIKQVIDATDKEIDKMVYQLYQLTPEEIKIVEGQ